MNRAQRFDIETEVDIVEMGLSERADEYRARRRATIARASAVHADNVDRVLVKIFNRIEAFVATLWRLATGTRGPRVPIRPVDARERPLSTREGGEGALDAEG